MKFKFQKYLKKYVLKLCQTFLKNANRAIKRKKMSNKSFFITNFILYELNFDQLTQKNNILPYETAVTD